MVRDLPNVPLEERRQDERYQRLMAATRHAARNGYDSVSMRELAHETRMSMTTIYQYCASKDHLIAEAHLEVMERISARLVTPPSGGPTARARVLNHIHEITDAWQQHEGLMRTLQRALYSLDPAVREVRTSLRARHLAIMDNAIGSDEVLNRAAVIDMVGHIIDSVTFRWVSGTLDTDEARRVLEQAVETLIPG